MSDLPDGGDALPAVTDTPLPKTARRRARELALQGVYAWQLSHASLADILDQVSALEGHAQADVRLLETLLRGVLVRAEELEALILPCLDRSFAALSPVERAILYIGAFELHAMPETPFKVIVNEAIDLGRSFGGTDGHKFVNGVLEKLSATLRPGEFARGRRGAPQAQPL
jgi:N utilization substance protein B